MLRTGHAGVVDEARAGDLAGDRFVKLVFELQVDSDG